MGSSVFIFHTPTGDSSVRRSNGKSYLREKKGRALDNSHTTIRVVELATKEELCWRLGTFLKAPSKGLNVGRRHTKSARLIEKEGLREPGPPWLVSGGVASQRKTRLAV